jgi:hypothetical protein
MLDIQKQTIAKLVAALNGVNASYKIILPDGTEYGALETKPVKIKGGRTQPYERGVLLAYVRPFLANLKPGEVAVIPAGVYDMDYLAPCAYREAFELYGKGGSTGARNDKNGTVEILRLG